MDRDENSDLAESSAAGPAPADDGSSGAERSTTTHRSTTVRPETLLDHVLDTMAAGLFTVDPDGLITSWNRGMEQMTGYGAAEALGQPCSILHGDACFAGAQGGEGEPCALFAGSPFQGKRCTIHHRDGRPINSLKNARLMRDPDGTVIGGIEAVTDIGEVLQLEAEVARLRDQCGGRTHFFKLIGRHPSMQSLYGMIERAGRARSPVLILGQTGTGKELVAHAVHKSSKRSEGPFVRVSCAALPESLLESELFGHTKGAFTGATGARKGRFESADGGTLFLDEIGDVSGEVQKKLLRVLQEREFERVGGNHSIQVDIRVVAATNRDLLALCDKGLFRRDLYYRLAAIPITLPPLSDRAADIPLLVDAFVERVNSQEDREIHGITSEALARFMAHRWPGNVRELLHAVEYACALTTTDMIDVDSLPPNLTASSPSPVPRGASRRSRPVADRAAIERALAETGGSRRRSAELLGVSRVTLWKWMKRFGIS